MTEQKITTTEILNHSQETIYVAKIHFPHGGLFQEEYTAGRIYDDTIKTFKDNVIISGNSYYFFREKDRNMFLLKWA